MSYLGPLRCHFAGRFQAAVSTVNNDPLNFDTAHFTPHYQDGQPENNSDQLGWNPRGSGDWRLIEYVVTSAWLADGTKTAGDDPVLTAIVADSDRLAPAKLVDLEVVHGRRLIPNCDAGPEAPPDQRYVYGGDPVTFDPDGVLAVPTNPTLAGYPDGSHAFRTCRTFNYTYTNLLKVLHVMLNGAPDRLGAAIGLMMSFKQQAQDLATGAIAGGMPVGASFEYQSLDG
jgi:hypothetical protein